MFFTLGDFWACMATGDAVMSTANSAALSHFTGLIEFFNIFISNDIYDAKMPVVFCTGCSNIK
jgi:hypothetical protein